jgi:hypothetical protein
MTGKPMGGIMKGFYAVLLIACASISGLSQSVAAKWAENSEAPFTLTITADPTNAVLDDTSDRAVKAGSSVVIRIRKTNTSDREIVKWPTTGGPFGDSFEVRDGSGKLVGLRKSNKVGTLGGGEGRLRGSKDMVLPPGESKIDYAQISDWYDMAEPGAYTVQVSQHVSSDPASDVVKSNTITITVLPAEEPPAAQQ